MNKANISKEKIVEVSVAFLMTEETADLNMRSIAARCNVSVGSLYNYFPTKDDLMIAVVAAIWKKAFEGTRNIKEDGSFPDYILHMYESVVAKLKEYPEFFGRHRSFFQMNKMRDGKNTMEEYIKRIKGNLYCVLEKDEKVNKKIWTKEFSKEAFIDFVFDYILSLLARNGADGQFFICLLEKTLY